ncbi:class I glutamine amidotransferase-like protein [Chytriomyces sp. MP71]|nr:class I glutamine amidotransferase-like protein [Chytriomyces sp. MP71]
MVTKTVAVLACDTPAQQIVDKEGDYPVMFERLLKKGLADLGGKPIDLHFEAFDVAGKGELPSATDLARLDVLLITGSKHGVNDGLPWTQSAMALLREVASEGRIKIVGICFGHQLVAAAFGGIRSCLKNPKGWEAGWTQMKLTDAGKQFLGDKDAVVSQFYSMHKDIVTVCPQGFTNLFQTDLCQYQSLVNHKKSVITIQSHPEFSPFTIREIVKLRKANAVFDTDYAEELMAIMDKDLPVDSAWFTQVILRFCFEQ